MTISTDYFDLWAKEDPQDLSILIHRLVVNPLVEKIKEATGYSISVDKAQYGYSERWSLTIFDGDPKMDISLGFSFSSVFTSHEIYDPRMENWVYLSEVTLSIGLPHPARQIVFGTNTTTMYEAWDFQNEWLHALISKMGDYLRRSLSQITVKMQNLDDGTQMAYARARNNSEVKKRMKDYVIQNIRVSKVLNDSRQIIETLVEQLSPTT